MPYITIYHPFAEQQNKSLSEILKLVCLQTGFTEAEMKSKCRKQGIVFARYAFYLLARRKTKASFPKIGEKLGQTHSNVIHGLKMAETEKEVQEIVSKISV
jgi:chromosomal replication initiator protein